MDVSAESQRHGLCRRKAGSDAHRRSIRASSAAWIRPPSGAEFPRSQGKGRRVASPAWTRNQDSASLGWPRPRRGTPSHSKTHTRVCMNRTSRSHGFERNRTHHAGPCPSHQTRTPRARQATGRRRISQDEHGAWSARLLQAAQRTRTARCGECRLCPEATPRTRAGWRGALAEYRIERLDQMRPSGCAA